MMPWHENVSHGVGFAGHTPLHANKDPGFTEVLADVGAHSVFGPPRFCGVFAIGMEVSPSSGTSFGEALDVAV